MDTPEIAELLCLMEQSAAGPWMERVGLDQEVLSAHFVPNFFRAIVSEKPRGPSLLDNCFCLASILLQKSPASLDNALYHPLVMLIHSHLQSSPFVSGAWGSFFRQLGLCFSFSLEILSTHSGRKRKLDPLFHPRSLPQSCTEHYLAYTAP